jgi:hypothetical protein
VDDGGETYLVYGRSGGAVLSGVVDLADVGYAIAGVQFEGMASGDRSGRSVAPAGDFNGDGLDDLLISAVSAGLGSGETYLVFGVPGVLGIPGDFDQDGDVDAFDLIIWQNGFDGKNPTSTRYCDGNADLDDDVDVFDLLIWQAHFGTAAVTTVPEPSTLGLLATTAFALLAFARRRR